MIHQSLTPCMEHRNHTELSVEAPLWILGKGLQGFIHCRKQHGQHDLFIAKDQLIKGVRKGEDKVEIATGKKLCLAVTEPFFLCHDLAFRTMPVPAGIIGNGFKTTLSALFDMPAKSSCAARLNMAYHLLLLI